VPRTDENGRQLKALLEYLLDGDIDAKDIYDALRISSSTYYRRIKDGDYPNAEELRLVSARFGLSYPDLQVRFGLMSRQEVGITSRPRHLRWRQLIGRSRPAFPRNSPNCNLGRMRPPCSIC